MEFNVGDRVRAISNAVKNKKVLGKTGVVVAVYDPLTQKYLVLKDYILIDFEDFQKGNDGLYFYDEPWFPEEAKKPGIQSYWGMRENEIEFISQAEDGKRKKTTEEETAAASTNSRQCANDAALSAPPQSPPTHDPKIHNALAQLCEEQEGVTDILAFQRVGCHTARTLYEGIGGFLWEQDGYGRREYHNLPGLSPSYCNLLTQMMMGEHRSATALRNALEHATQNATQEYEEAKITNAAEETEETETPQHKELLALFDRQLAILKERGVSEQIIEALRNQKNAVVRKAGGMTIGKGPFDGTQGKNIPFLPVIMAAYRGCRGLMSLVRDESMKGFAHLDPTAISDVVDAPSEPYYIYDVEDGSSTCGKSPENAQMSFKQQKRSGLTAAEVIALATHTDVLSKHYVWAAGSRYESADKMPIMYLDGGRPWLGWDYIADSRAHWGSASCLLRQ